MNRFILYTHKVSLRSIFKDFLNRAEDTDTDNRRCVDLPKLEKPFALSVEMVHKTIYNYILTMQDLELGLSVA